MQKLKQLVASKALEYVENGMKLGLGTGSTANEFIKLLSNKIKNGLKIQAIATSKQTEDLCAELGIVLCDLSDLGKLDLVVDGIDEVTKEYGAIKGGGGALLREKIAAYASENVIFIADETKLVSNLGKFPLPIEIAKFGYVTTQELCAELFLAYGFENIILLWRKDKNDELFVTDGGNYILDAMLHNIKNIEEVNVELLKIPGVVEHGLFLNVANKILLATTKGEVISI